MPYFKLTGPVAADVAMGEVDTLNTKTALNRLGEYEVPAYGLTPYPDAGIFDGLKRFQKKAGLRVDGVAKPGRETEAALDTALSSAAGPGPQSGTTEDQMARIREREDAAAKRRKAEAERQDAARKAAARKAAGAAEAARKQAAAPATAPALTLRSAVGSGRANLGGDVLGLTRALGWAGQIPEAGANAADGTAADDTLFQHLTAFQQASGLKVDGIANPRGETERTLNAVIAPFIEAATRRAAAAEEEPEDGERPEEPHDKEEPPEDEGGGEDEEEDGTGDVDSKCAAYQRQNDILLARAAGHEDTQQFLSQPYGVYPQEEQARYIELLIAHGGLPRRDYKKTYEVGSSSPSPVGPPRRSPKKGKGGGKLDALSDVFGMIIDEPKDVVILRIAEAYSDTEIATARKKAVAWFEQLEHEANAAVDAIFNEARRNECPAVSKSPIKPS